MVLVKHSVGGLVKISIKLYSYSSFSCLIKLKSFQLYNGLLVTSYCTQRQQKEWDGRGGLSHLQGDMHMVAAIGLAVKVPRLGLLHQLHRTTTVVKMPFCKFV